MRKMPLLTDCFLKRIPLFLPLSNKNFKLCSYLITFLPSYLRTYLLALIRECKVMYKYTYSFT